MAKDYKAIFYDWDGCIAKTLDTWLNAYKTVLAREEIYPSDKEIIDLFGNWDSPKILGHSNLESATRQVLEIVNAQVEDVTPYNGAIQSIKELKKRNYKIAVLTSTKHHTITKTGLYKVLQDSIDALICEEDVTKHKPDPEIITLGLEAFNLKKHEILMVGDSDKDLGAANNAGVDVALFASSQNEKFHDLAALTDEFKPTYVLKNHTDILEIV